MFLNVNGFGYSYQSPKSVGVRNLMIQKEVDVIGLAELNINWGKVKREQTLQQVARKWYETSRTAVAYNQHERRTPFKHQPGGTAVLAKDSTALRAHKAEYDSKRLGRWSSMVLHGKQGIRTRIVSVYVPNAVSKHGHKKVLVQQQRALLTMGIKDHALKIFWTDFWKEVDTWIDNGEQLIIAGDWNTDVTKKSFLDDFKLRELVPAMSTLHGTSLPETHNNGSRPIDEIFVSSTLDLRAAGYLEHGATMSDHRPIWIDVSKITMFGAKPALKPTFAARRLKTTDPRTVERYNTVLRDLLKKHFVPERAEYLANWVNGELTTSQQQEYENLDKIRTNAMEIAEKGCRKLKMGEVKWSPELQHAREVIRYYSLSRRKKLGRNVSSSLLQRLSKATGHHASTLSITQLDKKVDDAYDKYKELRKEDDKLRDSFLTELAEAWEKTGKGTKASHIKRIMATERQRATFRKIAVINNKQQDLSTKYITTTRNGKTIEVSDKDTMERLIVKENKDKYHQTEQSCPFMSGTLKEHFGPMGMGEHTTKVLKGEYEVPPGVTKQTEEYIKLCKIPSDELIINPLTRSLDYYCNSWKAMKERTASRTLHFGHYKAAVQDNTIMRCHYALAEVPFRTGYAPQRWKKANNVMILKKEGVTDLDRLRTLVLFEADFNHNNKFLGRKMMHHMKDTNNLAVEQYSAPGRKSIDQVLNRRLFFDLIRHKKTSAAMTAADLKSCYDRVAHAPACLALRSFGFPNEPIESMFTCIQDMQYYTFTAHGLSDISFGGLEKGYSAKPNGLGQGNGCAPSVWSIVSTKMFQVMHSRDAYTTITSPISGNNFQTCGFAYVDDTDLIATVDGKNSAHLAQQRMQYVLDEWEAVSKTTGGALAPHKCWSWIIDFKWKNAEWSYNDNSKGELKMTVKDEHDVERPVQILPPNIAQEMLGVHLAPDGNNQQQFEAMKDKMKKYAEYIRVGHVNRYEAWVSLSLVTLKSLEYSTPAMTLTQQQYKEIMAPVLKQFLPKAGINRNIKRDLLYAPAEAQGLNLQDPFITQGVSHVQDVTTNLWKNTTTGKLMRCNLEHLRLEIGDNCPSILVENYETYKPCFLTNTYLTNTWQFMSDHGITLNDDTPKISLLREGDSCIMEDFRNNPAITADRMASLNKCRMYLKVFTLSDITAGCGKRIRDEAWHGVSYSTGRDDSKWPIWGRPTPIQWTQWRTALKSTYCDCGDKILRTPLGRWTTILPSWQWFSLQYDGSPRLIRKSKGVYKMYKRIGRSNLNIRFRKLCKKVQLSKDVELIPTTVRDSDGFYIMSPVTSPMIKQEREQPVPSTSWLHLEEYRRGSNRNLKNAILSHQALAVSDGSYSEVKGIGTASWIVTTRDKESYVTAGALSPGQSSIQSSFRSELIGLLGILDMLHSFCNQHNISQGGCTILCDGITALNTVQYCTRDSFRPNKKSSDIISACIALKEAIPIHLTFAHVKGHQDTDTPYHKLSLPSQLNVLMDGIAKRMLQNHTIDEANSLSPHHLSIKLPRFKSQYIRQNIQKDLYDAITTQKLHKYWVEDKKRFTRESESKIDWSAHRTCITTMKSTKQRTMTKWVSGWVGVGKNMERWQLRYKGSCPFCKYPKETTLHVLQCKHSEPTKIWKKVLKELDLKLIKMNTNYNLRRAIVNELWAWRANQFHYLPSITSYDTDLQECIKEQRLIGWEVFLEGLISTKLIQYQRDYQLRSQETVRTFTWHKKLIKAGWAMISEMWDHRNKQLHTTKTLQEMQGIRELNKVILTEWELGLNKLPTLEFSHLFRLKKSELKKKSVECKKDWLAIVRLGRYLYDDTRHIDDEFHTNKALRDWIGLPNEKDMRTDNNIN